MMCAFSMFINQNGILRAEPQRNVIELPIDTTPDICG